MKRINNLVDEIDSKIDAPDDFNIIESQIHLNNSPKKRVISISMYAFSLLLSVFIFSFFGFFLAKTTEGKENRVSLTNKTESHLYYAYDYYVKTPIIVEKINDNNVLQVYYGVLEDNDYLLIDLISTNSSSLKCEINNYVYILDDDYIETNIVPKNIDIIYTLYNFIEVSGVISIDLSEYCKLLEN